MRRTNKTLIGRQPTKVHPNVYAATQAQYDNVIAELKDGIGLIDEMLSRATFGLIAVVHFKDNGQSVTARTEVEGIHQLVKAAAELHDAFYLPTCLDATMYRNTIYYYENISHVETAVYYIGDNGKKFENPGVILEDMMPMLMYAGDLYQLLHNWVVFTPEELKEMATRREEHAIRMEKYADTIKEDTDHVQA